MVYVTFSFLTFILSFGIVKCQFYYKELTSFKPIKISKECVKTIPQNIINCTIFQLSDVKVEAECLNENVIRIIGEYDTVRIICSSKDALDFRYHGIQPTEAINVEWYKEVLPFTNATISSFGVDIRIRSVDSLHRFFTSKFKNDGNLKLPPRHDYPRSGNYIFRGIYNTAIETNIFIYFEDSGTPAFLRNIETRATFQNSQLHLPCIPSHYDMDITLNFENETSKEVNFDFIRSNATYQGLLVNVTSEELVQYYGTYTCTMNHTTDINSSSVLELEFTVASLGSELRFGLNKAIPKELGQTIKYYSRESRDRNIDIQIACKVHKLGAPTYLAGIEAENFAMMNLKREFTFPEFVNQSYTADYINTVGELTFEIKLDGTFKTRYGGATYCQSGDYFEVEEFAVPFVGDVSKRLFDTDWTKFRRETSNIRIHYELKILRDENDNEELYAGTELTFECKFIVAIVVKPAVWYTTWRNGSTVEEMVDYNWMGKLEDTSYFKKKLHVDLVGVNCSASFYYASFWRFISESLQVTAGIEPKIEDPTEDLILRVGTLNQGVTCTATGRPTPKLSWFKGGLQLHAFLTANGSLLHQIPKVESSHAGEYVCKAQNVYGMDEKIFKYEVDGDKSNYGSLIGIPISVFLLTILGASVYVKFFRKEKVGLSRAEVEEFLAGEKNTVRNSTAYAHEFAHLTPYDKSFELADNKFQIDTTEILGTGAYGVVLKGLVEGRPAAVKTTKKNAEKAYLKALLSELKIMIYLGNHENIIQLIGASTKDLDRGSVYIFVPFCGLGNLEKYLRTSRNLYDETEPMEYRNLESGEFSFKDLLSWSIQVANGMEYLSTRKVIHGDLAARNILLTDKRQAKITDFGLSRQLYGYASYVKKHQEPLPWRWMALESLRDLSFSTLSDIWSYGILLWEIFSLGEVPYPGMAWTLDFVDELDNGLRMSRPKRAPEFIYTRIFYLCWHKIPTKRPSFTLIRETFEEFDNLYPSDNKRKRTVDGIHKTQEKKIEDMSSTKGNVYTNF